MAGLPPLSAQIEQINAIARRAENFEWLIRTATPELAARLGASWRLYDAEPGVHLSTAQAGVHPYSETWAHIQATSEASRADGPAIGQRVRAGALVAPPAYGTAVFDDAGAFQGLSGLDSERNEKLAVLTQVLVSDSDVTRKRRPGPTHAPGFTHRSFGEALQSGQISVGEALEAFDESFGDASPLGLRMGLALEAGADNALTRFITNNPIAGKLGDIAKRIGQTKLVDDFAEPAINVGVTVLDTPYQMAQAEFRRTLASVRERGFVGAATQPFTDPRGLTGEALTQQLGTDFGALTVDVVEEFTPQIRGALRTVGVDTTPSGLALPQPALSPNDPRTFALAPVGPDNRLVGEGVNIGEGFFPGGGAAGDFRLAVERANTPRIQGQAATFGRFVAQPFDAGSKAHTILSGAVDAGVLLALDRSLASGFRHFRRGEQFLRDEPVQLGSRLIDDLVEARTGDRVRDAFARHGITGTLPDPDEIAAIDNYVDMRKAFASSPESVVSSSRLPTPRGVDEVPTRARLAVADLDHWAEGGGLGDHAVHLWRQIGGTNVTRTIDEAAVRSFVDGEDGTKWFNAIANSTDTRAIDTSTGKALSPTTLRRLADETDVAEVRRILTDELGVTIRGKPSRLRSSSWDAVRDSFPTVQRWRHTTPDPAIDIHEGRNFVNDIMGQVANTRGSEATARRWHDRAVRAANPSERFNVAEEFFSETGIRMVLADAAADGAVRGTRRWRSGVADARTKLDEWARVNGLDADELWENAIQGKATGLDFVDDLVADAKRFYEPRVKMFTETLQDGRVWDADLQTGLPRDPWRVVADGQLHEDRVPHLYSELINSSVPAPDYRVLRAEFSKLRGLYLKANDDLGLGGRSAFGAFYDGLRNVQTGLWKPLILGSRLAWPIRVIGEEQFRLAANGLPSMVSHPIQHIAVMLGRGGRRLGRFSDDALENSFHLVDEHVAAMNKGAAGWLNERGSLRYLDNWKVVNQADVAPQQFADAWAEQLERLAHDRVARVLLNNDFDEALRIFTTEMDEVRHTLHRSREAYVGRRAGEVIDIRTHEGAAQYLTSIQRRIDDLAGAGPGRAASPDIIDAMRNRRLGDVAMSDGRAFRDALAGRLGEAPPFMPAREVSRITSRESKAWDRAVEWWFGQLMSRPTNALSRSPVFRQTYWSELGRIVGRIDRSDLDALMDAARAANLPNSEIRQMSRFMGRSGRGTPAEAIGTLTLKEADHHAKALSLASVQDMLFDLSRRNQFFDVAQLIFPFGDAWLEVVSNWARIVRNNPNVVRRAEQIIEFGRNEGWLTRDEQTGEEFFNYPISDDIMGFGSNLPIPLKGRLSGISLATDVGPGVGLFAQLPLSVVLPDTTDFDALEELLLPYGRAGGGSIPETIYEEFIPPHVRRIITGLGAPATESEIREQRSLFGNALAYLMSSGEYDLGNPDRGIVSAETTRLVEDAKEYSARFTLWRGIVQSTAPSAPTPDWYILDEDGERVHFDVMREAYQALFTEDAETATMEFFEMFGRAGLAAVQGRTISTVPGRVPTSVEADAWFRDNSGFADDYSNVSHFFAPQVGTFSFQARDRVLDRGLRETLDNDDYFKRHQDTMGQLRYTERRDSIEEELREAGWTRATLPMEARVHLAEFDQRLTEVLPGYPGRGEFLAGGQTARQTARNEMALAIQDPRIADEPLARNIGAFVQRWDELDAVYGQMRDEMGLRALTWYESSSTAEFRDHIVEVAETLIRDTPEFRNVYEALYEPEIAEALDRAEEEVEVSG